MIDQMITLILREARGRPGKDRVGNIYAVMEDLEQSIMKVIENVRFIERRKEENEKYRAICNDGHTPGNLEGGS